MFAAVNVAVATQAVYIGFTASARHGVKGDLFAGEGVEPGHNSAGFKGVAGGGMGECAHVFFTGFGATNVKPVESTFAWVF